MSEPYILPSAGCCRAGAIAYPHPCPWHPPDAAAPREYVADRERAASRGRTTMASSPELPVPDAAVEMLSRTITAQLTLSATGHCVNTRDHDAVRDIAEPVVAAELRRMADGYAAGDTISESFARDLYARADEIERQ